MYFLKRIRTIHLFLLAPLFVLCVPKGVFAAGEKQGVSMVSTYKSECGACHVAYPPSMLSASSWDRLLHSLPQHFGVDASLDAVTSKSINEWLDVYANSNKRRTEEPSEDRITRTTWFVGRHREIAQTTWKRKSIQSASNCSACHARADQGDFDEDTVRIPK